MKKLIIVLVLAMVGMTANAQISNVRKEEQPHLYENFRMGACKFYGVEGKTYYLQIVSADAPLISMYVYLGATWEAAKKTVTDLITELDALDTDILLTFTTLDGKHEYAMKRDSWDSGQCYFTRADNYEGIGYIYIQELKTIAKHRLK